MLFLFALFHLPFSLKTRAWQLPQSEADDDREGFAWLSGLKSMEMESVLCHQADFLFFLRATRSWSSDSNFLDLLIKLGMPSKTYHFFCVHLVLMIHHFILCDQHRDERAVLSELQTDCNHWSLTSICRVSTQCFMQIPAIKSRSLSFEHNIGTKKLEIQRMR